MNKGASLILSLQKAFAGSIPKEGRRFFSLPPSFHIRANQMVKHKQSCFSASNFSINPASTLGCLLIRETKEQNSRDSNSLDKLLHFTTYEASAEAKLGPI